MKHKVLRAEFWKTILGFNKTSPKIPESSSESKQALQETTLANQPLKSDEIQPEHKGIQLEKKTPPERKDTKEIEREDTNKTKIEKERKHLIVRSELNLEQNSIFTVSTYRGKSREIVVEETKPGGEVFERRAIIGKTAGGIETGVLTTYHFKVYLALLELWERAGRPVSEPVHFTILRIIRRLELSHDGRTYARMKRWLLDMGQIPLTFINSFFAPEDGLYQTLDPFHVLSYLRIYERKKVGKHQKTYGYGEFQFDRHILENLVNNHTHPLRLDVINSFRKHKDLSILLYVYLDRNLAFKDKYEIGLEKLFGHLDLSEKQIRYPSDRKVKIEPVLEQLRGKELSTGILSHAQIAKTKYGADYKLVCHKKHFVEGLKSGPTSWDKIELPEASEISLESAKSNSELLSILIEKGLTEKQAAKLIAEKDPVAISAQLTYLPFRLREYESQNKDINEPAILYESISDNWKVPKTYLEAEKEKEREAERGERERIACLEQEERDRAEQERAKIEAYKENLDSGQRAKLRERALTELRNTEGIQEQFIGEPLIAAKENEILKSEKD